MDSDNDNIYEDDAPPEQTFEKDLQDIVNNLTPARMFLPLVVIGRVTLTFDRGQVYGCQ